MERSPESGCLSWAWSSAIAPFCGSALGLSGVAKLGINTFLARCTEDKYYLLGFFWYSRYLELKNLGSLDLSRKV